MITGSTLKDWGFIPGKWFGDALIVAQEMEMNGQSEDKIFAKLQELMPKEVLLRTNGIPYSNFLEPETENENENADLVMKHMDALLRVPTIKQAAIMPDACPSGSQEGTIPVGGVVATENAIHPGFHSSDVCCSVFMSVFERDEDVKKVMDIAMQVTHFGAGGRDKPYETEVLKKFSENKFLAGLEGIGLHAMATQGDGNHFLFVGRRRSDGKITLVTHHGSRNVGAQLYKRGTAAAYRHTSIVAPKVPKHNAWIKADSDEGQEYWKALQIVREWTKLNHQLIHDMIQKKLGNKIIDRFWNEHNFVFQRSDGLFYHAKGATPSYKGFSEDDDGRTLIPLNMGQPILITSHTDAPGTLGFAPHGAGRNMGRKAYLRNVIGDRNFLEVFTEETKSLDVRFYCGVPDISELPGAYKNPAQIIAGINKFNLAKIEDYIDPLGSIMAGEPVWRVPIRR